MARYFGRALVSEDIVREVGLAAGLTNLRMSAVDTAWSALKRVHRLADRARG